MKITLIQKEVRGILSNLSKKPFSMLVIVAQSYMAHFQWAGKRNLNNLIKCVTCRGTIPNPYILS